MNVHVLKCISKVNLRLRYFYVIAPRYEGHGGSKMGGGVGSYISVSTVFEYAVLSPKWVKMADASADVWR